MFLVLLLYHSHSSSSYSSCLNEDKKHGEKIEVFSTHFKERKKVGVWMSSRIGSVRKYFYI
jgi:hypothetical protein